MLVYLYCDFYFQGLVNNQVNYMMDATCRFSFQCRSSVGETVRANGLNVSTIT